MEMWCRWAVIHALVLVCIGNAVSDFDSYNMGCPEGSFMCLDGDCIRNSKHCDGVKDCRDGNDEWDCDRIKCEGPNFFRCDNNKCISTAFRCDTENDCGDQSDEKDCDLYMIPETAANCSEKEFQCLDKLCIPKYMVCDGTVDCLDGSDEILGCSTKIDCEDGFMCKNKHCIPSEFHCDGSNDCTDGSDEENCAGHVDSSSVPMSECTTENRYLACKDQSTCLDIHLACDGVNQCPDGSDEGGSCADTCDQAHCEHQCFRTPNGPKCVCPKGMKMENGHCLDIDECQSYGVCDQRCRNTEPGYQCYCDEGYKLQNDRRTCRAEGSEALMVFAAGNTIRGYYLSSEVLYRVSNKLGQVAGIGYDGFHIYWTNVMRGEEAIMRSNEDGSNKEVVVTAGLGLPEDLAVDWITQNIYFTDSEKKYIGVCSSDGSSCTALVESNVDQPRSLAILPTKRKMYWSDWGDKAMISQAGMDGSNSSVLVSSDIHWPNGLALDYHNDRLYWVDAKRQKIETIKLDGSDRRVVLEKVLKHPFDIAVFEDSLYWSDWEGRQILACDKFTGKNHRSLIRERKNKVYGVHIFHSSMQHRNVTNPCKEAGCSDLCLLSPNQLGYSCTCPQDRILSVDKHTCRESSKRQTIYAGAGHSLVQIETRVLGKLALNTIPLRAIHKMGPLAYDSISGSVIITDSVQKKIYSYNLQSTRLDVLVGYAVGTVMGMDFDELGNNLYWCDSERNTVEVVSLQSRERTVVLRDLGGETPLDVALVPRLGVMFVAFSNDYGVHIDRFSMDGHGGRTHVIETGIEGPKVSLWYDQELDRVFWSDSGLGMIESTSVEGSDRHALRSPATAIHDITTLSDDLFWVDTHSSTLRWVNKYDGLARSKKLDMEIKEGIDAPSLIGVRGIVSNEHQCQINNGGCSHLCLLSANSMVCACPEGMVLRHDNHTCVTPIHCTQTQFKCKTDDICIPKNQRCNGKHECPSGDDELNCKPTCHYGQFACNNGQCIDESLRCDFHHDCTDKSDETSCDIVQCDPFTQFTCASGQCISLQWRCNYASDCHDGSDEENCEDSTCSPGVMFRCKSGACIPATWECDKELDCPDGSDEHANCAPVTCSPSHFQCDNGGCIDNVLKCDWQDDCGDGSDEKGCVRSVVDNAVTEDPADKFFSCKDGEFQCTSEAKCLPAGARCNGTAECMGGEDETDCSGCQGHEFQCKNGNCIPSSWLCDQYNDCKDNSDEELRQCKVAEPALDFDANKPCNTFRCGTGECLPWSMVCNVHEDCPDASDEGGRCITACSEGHPCAGLCVRTPHGPHCSCHGGYQLTGDGRNCEDVNECLEDDPCSQLCENTDGNFECSCAVEYVLRPDKVSCKAAGSALEYVFSTGEQLRKSSATKSHLVVLSQQPGLEVSGVDVDARRNHIYWSTGETGALHRISAGISLKSEIRGLGMPGKMAVDWITRNVYFTDRAQRGSIRVCSFEQQLCARINRGEDGESVGAIAVDPMSGLIFWSQVTLWELSAPTSHILVSDLAGQNVTTLPLNDLSLVTGIALDLVKRRVYWADQNRGVIERTDYSGDNRVLIRNYEVNHPLGLTLFEDSLYWLNAGSGSMTKCRLYGKPLRCETVHMSSSEIKHLSIMQSARQPDGDNPCSSMNCTHLCVLSRVGAKCICEDGTIIRPGRSCMTAPEAEMEDVTKPSFHFNIDIAKTSDNETSNKASVIGPLIAVILVVVLVALFLAYKRRSAPGLSWPNLPLGFSIGKMTGSDAGLAFDNQAFGMGSSRQDPFQPSSVTPGEHEYENPSLQKLEGKLSMSSEMQSWSAPKRVLQAPPIDLEDDYSDAEFVDGDYDEARLIP